MADAKKQLILDLLARNRMSKDTNQAADDIDRLGRSAEDADKKTKGLGESSTKTSGQVDKLGHNLDHTKGRISSLNDEIKVTERELGSLAGSFADAGSASERIDISKAIRRTQADLRNLTKNKSLLENLLPDPEPEVKKWGQRLGTSLAGVGANIASLAGSSPGITIGVALVAAATPVLAGGISAAITAGAAAGVIGLGAVLLSKDKEIAGYATRIGKGFKDNLTKSASGALEGPFLASLGKVEAFADRSAVKIGKMFTDVAPSVDHFTDSIVNSGDAVLNGLGKAVARSGPALDGFGDSLVLLSGGVEKFLDEVSQGGPEAASNLRLIAGAMGDVIGQTGTFLNVLNQLSGNPWITGPLLPLLKAHYNDNAKAANEAADSTNNLAKAQDTAMAAADRHKAAIEALSKELKGEVDPAFAVLNAIDGVRDAQRNATDATKKYGSQSEQARDATRKLAEAALTLQGAASDAGGMLNGKLSPALYASLKAAGLTKSQMDGVERELRRARDAAKAYEGTYKATIKTYYISVTGTERLDPSGHRIGGYRAAGGPVQRGTPYVVGENGPEVMVPESGGRVISASATRGLMAQAATKGLVGQMAAASAGPRAVQLEVVGNDQAIVSLIKRLVRTANLLEA